MWLWYASRATGLVSLVLLTGTVLLGVSGVARLGTPAWPRFAVALLHRNLSLLVLAFLAVHVGTVVLEGLSPTSWTGIGWIDAVVPFVAGYEPFWLGLGTVALDLLLALIATSLLRARLGLRAWRIVHMGAYACWPLAVAHGLGVGGSDSTTGWILGLTLACVAAVGGAVLWRIRLAGTDASRSAPAVRR